MRNVLSLLVLGCTIILVASFGDTMIGTGRWQVLEILPCKEPPENFPSSIKMSKKKFSRTQDCFSLHMHLKHGLNETFGVEVEVLKETGNVFKFFQMLTDESMCNFMHKYAEEIFITALDLAGINPPDCPIPAGDVMMEELIIDFETLPEKGIYGKYDVSGYVTLMEERMACVRLLMQFDVLDDDE